MRKGRRQYLVRWQGDDPDAPGQAWVTYEHYNSLCVNGQHPGVCPQPSNPVVTSDFPLGSHSALHLADDAVAKAIAEVDRVLEAEAVDLEANDRRTEEMERCPLRTGDCVVRDEFATSGIWRVGTVKEIDKESGNLTIAFTTLTLAHGLAKRASQSQR